MKKRLLLIVLAISVFLLPLSARADVAYTHTSSSAFASDLTSEAVYQKMIALKSQYPEGMRWTNDNYYAWNGGIFSVGYGCAGFAFILSDAAFGNLPARQHKNFSLIKVGDILRINNDTHSVIVLSINDSIITVAEGNYNSSIHWGRTFTWSDIQSVGNYVMTRYPDSIPDTTPSTQFSDVYTSDWYYKSVIYCYENGIMSGTGDGKFSPNSSLSRAMLATVLYRLDNEPSVVFTNSFSDVPSGQWYSNAIIWANSNKIVMGYGNGKFGVHDFITREQIATMLYRYAQYKGYDISAVSDLSAYKDVSHISSWAFESMKWSVASGLISGISSDTLHPTGSASRAQCAAILHRFLLNIAR